MFFFLLYLVCVLLCCDYKLNWTEWLEQHNIFEYWKRGKKLEKKNENKNIFKNIKCETHVASGCCLFYVIQVEFLLLFYTYNTIIFFLFFCSFVYKTCNETIQLYLKNKTKNETTKTKTETEIQTTLTTP